MHWQLHCPERNSQFSYMIMVAPVTHPIRKVTMPMYGPTIHRRGMEGHFTVSSVMNHTGSTAMATVLMSSGSPCHSTCISSGMVKNMMSLL